MALKVVYSKESIYQQKICEHLTRNYSLWTKSLRQRQSHVYLVLRLQSYHFIYKIQFEKAAKFNDVIFVDNVRVGQLMISDKEHTNISEKVRECQNLFRDIENKVELIDDNNIDDFEKQVKEAILRSQLRFVLVRTKNSLQVAFYDDNQLIREQLVFNGREVHFYLGGTPVASLNAMCYATQSNFLTSQYAKQNQYTKRKQNTIQKYYKNAKRLAFSIRQSKAQDGLPHAATKAFSPAAIERQVKHVIYQLVAQVDARSTDYVSGQLMCVASESANKSIALYHIVNCIGMILGKHCSQHQPIYLIVALAQSGLFNQDNVDVWAPLLRDLAHLFKQVQQKVLLVSKQPGPHSHSTIALKAAGNRLFYDGEQIREQWVSNEAANSNNSHGDWQAQQEEGYPITEREHTSSGIKGISSTRETPLEAVAVDSCEQVSNHGRVVGLPKLDLKKVHKSSGVYSDDVAPSAWRQYSCCSSERIASIPAAFHPTKNLSQNVNSQSAAQAITLLTQHNHKMSQLYVLAMSNKGSDACGAESELAVVATQAEPSPQHEYAYYDRNTSPPPLLPSNSLTESTDLQRLNAIYDALVCLINIACTNGALMSELCSGFVWSLSNIVYPALDQNSATNSSSINKLFMMTANLAHMCTCVAQVGGSAGDDDTALQILIDTTMRVVGTGWERRLLDDVKLTLLARCLNGLSAHLTSTSDSITISNSQLVAVLEVLLKAERSVLSSMRSSALSVQAAQVVAEYINTTAALHTHSQKLCKQLNAVLHGGVCVVSQFSIARGTCMYLADIVLQLLLDQIYNCSTANDFDSVELPYMQLVYGLDALTKSLVAAVQCGGGEAAQSSGGTSIDKQYVMEMQGQVRQYIQRELNWAFRSDRCVLVDIVSALHWLSNDYEAVLSLVSKLFMLNRHVLMLDTTDVIAYLQSLIRTLWHTYGSINDTNIGFSEQTQSTQRRVVQIVNCIRSVLVNSDMPTLRKSPVMQDLQLVLVETLSLESKANSREVQVVHELSRKRSRPQFEAPPSTNPLTSIQEASIGSEIRTQHALASVAQQTKPSANTTSQDVSLHVVSQSQASSPLSPQGTSPFNSPLKHTSVPAVPADSSRKHLFGKKLTVRPGRGTNQIKSGKQLDSLDAAVLQPADSATSPALTQTVTAVQLGSPMGHDQAQQSPLSPYFQMSGLMLPVPPRNAAFISGSQLLQDQMSPSGTTSSLDFTPSQHMPHRSPFAVPNSQRCTLGLVHGQAVNSPGSDSSDAGPHTYSHNCKQTSSSSHLEASQQLSTVSDRTQTYLPPEHQMSLAQWYCVSPMKVQRVVEPFHPYTALPVAAQYCLLDLNALPEFEERLDLLTAIEDEFKIDVDLDQLREFKHVADKHGYKLLTPDEHEWHKQVLRIHSESDDVQHSSAADSLQSVHGSDMWQATGVLLSRAHSKASFRVDNCEVDCGASGSDSEVLHAAVAVLTAVQNEEAQQSKTGSLSCSDSHVWKAAAVVLAQTSLDQMATEPTSAFASTSSDDSQVWRAAATVLAQAKSEYVGLDMVSDDSDSSAVFRAAAVVLASAVSGGNARSPGSGAQQALLQRQGSSYQWIYNASQIAEQISDCDSVDGQEAGTARHAGGTASRLLSVGVPSQNATPVSPLLREQSNYASSSSSSIAWKHAAVEVSESVGIDHPELPRSGSSQVWKGYAISVADACGDSPQSSQQTEVLGDSARQLTQSGSSKAWRLGAEAIVKSTMLQEDRSSMDKYVSSDSDGWKAGACLTVRESYQQGPSTQSTGVPSHKQAQVPNSQAQGSSSEPPVPVLTRGASFSTAIPELYIPKGQTTPPHPLTTSATRRGAGMKVQSSSRLSRHYSSRTEGSAGVSSEVATSSTGALSSSAVYNTPEAGGSSVQYNQHYVGSNGVVDIRNDSGIGPERKPSGNAPLANVRINEVGALETGRSDTSSHSDASTAYSATPSTHGTSTASSVWSGSVYSDSEGVFKWFQPAITASKQPAIVCIDDPQSVHPFMEYPTALITRLLHIPLFDLLTMADLVYDLEDKFCDELPTGELDIDDCQQFVKLVKANGYQLVKVDEQGDPIDPTLLQAARAASADTAGAHTHGKQESVTWSWRRAVDGGAWVDESTDWHPYAQLPGDLVALVLQCNEYDLDEMVNAVEQVHEQFKVDLSFEQVLSLRAVVKDNEIKLVGFGQGGSHVQRCLPDEQAHQYPDPPHDPHLQTIIHQLNEQGTRGLGSFDAFTGGALVTNLKQFCKQTFEHLVMLAGMDGNAAPLSPPAQPHAGSLQQLDSTSPHYSPPPYQASMPDNNPISNAHGTDQAQSAQSVQPSAVVPVTDQSARDALRMSGRISGSSRSNSASRVPSLHISPSLVGRQTALAGSYHADLSDMVTQVLGGGAKQGQGLQANGAEGGEHDVAKGSTDAGLCEGYFGLRQSYPLYKNINVHAAMVQLAMYMLVDGQGVLQPVSGSTLWHDQLNTEQAVKVLYMHVNFDDNKGMAQALSSLIQHECESAHLHASMAYVTPSLAPLPTSTSPTPTGEALSPEAGQTTSGGHTVLDSVPAWVNGTIVNSNLDGVDETGAQLRGTTLPLHTQRLHRLLNRCCSTALDSFHIDCVLSNAGAFSQVFLLRARDAPKSQLNAPYDAFGASLPPVSERLVVKQSELNDVGGSFQLERVYNEVRVLQRLAGSKSSTKLVDYGTSFAQDTGVPYFYIMMPRYAGSLEAWRKRLPAYAGGQLRLYLRVFREVVRAVHETHSYGVVHFDVKCGNVLIDRKEHEPNQSLLMIDSEIPPFDIVLGDFGEAQVLAPYHMPPGNACAAAMSETHHAGGTECIKAPEVHALSLLKCSDEQYDRRFHYGASGGSDVWSLGCMLYELITANMLVTCSTHEVFGRVYYAQSSLVDAQAIETLKNVGAYNPLIIHLLHTMLDRDVQRRITLTVLLRLLDSFIDGSDDINGISMQQLPVHKTVSTEDLRN